MRPSTASAPLSQLQSQAQSHPPPSAAQLARLADKKKEFEAVDALQRASALFLRRLEGLADDCEAMAEAGIGPYLFFLIVLSIC
jgi:DASH complex subunit DAD2